MPDNVITIAPELCFSKSDYARKIKKTPTWVNKLIESGKLHEIKFNGGSLVTAEQPPHENIINIYPA